MLFRGISGRTELRALDSGLRCYSDTYGRSETAPGHGTFSGRKRTLGPRASSGLAHATTLRSRRQEGELLGKSVRLRFGRR
jgi:hypothetical protein